MLVCQNGGYELFRPLMMVVQKKNTGDKTLELVVVDVGRLCIIPVAVILVCFRFI